MKTILLITLFSFGLLFTSCENKTLIGTWVGSVNNDNNTTTHYTITIENNGLCKIIEKENGVIYTYLGTWEEKFGYLGESKRYDWIQLDGATEELYEYMKQNTYKSSVYGELRGETYKLKSKKKITLTMTPDGKIWGASLDAKRLANYPNEGTQLVKQNNPQTIEEPTASVNDNIIEEKDDTPLEEPTKPISHEDVKRVALWVYSFDDGGYSISYELELFNNNNAVYRPCHDDCGYVGKYTFKQDSLIFSGIDETDPEYPSKIRVAFLRKDGKLINNSGEIYIDVSKPTMYEVVQMLTGRIFVGKKNNYYFTYDFTYTVLDEQDNAMFWCKYEEFELNSNYGNTPMEILRQSANSATFLKSEKLMVTVMKNDLHNNMIVVKRIRAYDDMPRFDFWVTEIERDSEGNLEQARIDAQALGVRLNGIRK